MADAKLPNLASLKTLGTLPVSGDADVAGLCVGDVCVVDDAAFAKAEVATEELDKKPIAARKVTHA